MNNPIKMVGEKEIKILGFHNSHHRPKPGTLILLLDNKYKKGGFYELNS